MTAGIQNINASILSHFYFSFIEEIIFLSSIFKRSKTILLLGWEYVHLAIIQYHSIIIEK